MSADEPDNITLELRIQLNGQRWTLVADEIIAAAEGLGVTVTESRLSRYPDDAVPTQNRQGDAVTVPEEAVTAAADRLNYLWPHTLKDGEQYQVARAALEAAAPFVQQWRDLLSNR